MTESRRFLIMAGGTGGHVFPALATARALQEKGHDVHWLGAVGGMEERLVGDTGIPLSLIHISGLRGKGKLAQMMAPFRLMRALGEAFTLMRRIRPDCVVGMGGFVTGPGGLASWLTRTPLVIHEQNAIAGMTNRILVVGGSLGAQVFNQQLPEAMALLPEGERPQIRHQCGEKHIDAARASYEQHGVEAELEPFIDDMANAYCWADVVLCRAGALTISELCAAGIGAVLVPFPYAVDDHQTKNGQQMVNAKAAVLIPQSQL
ncbi:MAG TPA: UDP-N-acetylglucosamine--N-acetylmuramyl-(pentapeptide) pyrophosphoryl-undecaprenol N-acetylglucosamine transferase, partial [Marinobacter sp.]|nr:UDP-N-acetylglucosamine--N-acetylmuramyl-(pentapeptide) pyrophosphoryl-undecaprenol N-acetylglucosamine transferase [Marinobacter sp.]